MTASSSPSHRTSDRGAEGPRATPRRDFIRVGVGALVSLGLAPSAGCTPPVRSFRAPMAGAIEIPVARYPELEQPGGMVKVVGPGRFRAIFVRGLDGGAYDGISAVCTHQGCIVQPLGDAFLCPCHGSRFDRSGEPQAGPARRALMRFKAERRGAVVRVELEPESP
jgi:Rieske Fe-S protein